MIPHFTLRDAFESPHLLKPVMGGESREPMRSILLASQGEPLTPTEIEHYKRLTGGREYQPGTRANEAHIISGRRSGKSSGVSSLAVYLSALVDWSDRLSPGETGVVLSLRRESATSHRCS